jgi:hypothetical protein
MGQRAGGFLFCFWHFLFFIFLLLEQPKQSPDEEDIDDNVHRTFIHMNTARDAGNDEEYRGNEHNRHTERKRLFINGQGSEKSGQAGNK